VGRSRFITIILLYRSVRATVPRVVNAPTFLALTLFLRFGGGRPLHNVLTLVLRILTEYLTVRFTSSSQMVVSKILRMSSPSYDVVSPLSLCSVFHCCLPVSLDASSRTSVLSGFLVQPCLCFVPDDSVSLHCPGSLSSAAGGALRLDVSPHTSLVLQKFPLQPLL
jgi:hypothetical protein